MIAPALQLLGAAAERHALWLGRVLASPAALQALKLFRAVAPSLDEALAKDIVRDYVQLDFDVYSKILMSLGDHDASEVLPAIGVPTLVVAGTRDPMTPLLLAEQMVRQIPGAELFVMKGGSHYLPVEFPDLLNEAVLRFLGRL